MIQSLRGMNDILADDYERFEYFLSQASTIAKRYGFHYIETPLLEETARITSYNVCYTKLLRGFQYSEIRNASQWSKPSQ